MEIKENNKDGGLIKLFKYEPQPCNSALRAKWPQYICIHFIQYKLYIKFIVKNQKCGF